MVYKIGPFGRVGRGPVILEKAVIIIAMVTAFFYWDFTKSCSHFTKALIIIAMVRALLF